MRCLIVSNGHGEDTIALTILNALKKQNSSLRYHIFPLVGNGHCFVKAGYDVACENPVFPSGGFIRSFSVLRQDIEAGLIGHHLKRRKQLKDCAKDVDMIIAVGDVFCLFMARFAGVPVYFFPTAKSDSFMPHSFLERVAIRRWASHVYPRDQQTTDNFINLSLEASFFGNPMMDDLETTRRIQGVETADVLLGILPGSRAEAAQNLVFCLDICRYYKQHIADISIVCAYVNGLNVTDVADRAGWHCRQTEQGYDLHDPVSGQHVLCIQDFLAVINQATLCIGLAGTANEQALFLGKKVVCFEGFGPQSTLQRFYEQRLLMGDGLDICDVRDVEKIAKRLHDRSKQRGDQPHSKKQAVATDIVRHIMSFHCEE